MLLVKNGLVEKSGHGKNSADYEVKNYCVANNATLQLQSGKTQEGIAAIIEKSRADFAKSGITDKAPLFVYWDIRNIKFRHFVFVQG